MTDLDLLKRCAEKMGIVLLPESNTGVWWFHSPPHSPLISRYDPLHDDAQCMGLIKRLHLTCFAWDDGTWSVNAPTENTAEGPRNSDLNRAVVECCARIPD